MPSYEWSNCVEDLYELSQALGSILIVLFLWQGAVEQKTLSKIQVFGANDWRMASFYIEQVCYKGC